MALPMSPHPVTMSSRGRPPAPHLSSPPRLQRGRAQPGHMRNHNPHCHPARAQSRPVPGGVFLRLPALHPLGPSTGASPCVTTGASRSGTRLVAPRAALRKAAVRGEARAPGWVLRLRPGGTYPRPAAWRGGVQVTTWHMAVPIPLPLHPPLGAFPVQEDVVHRVIAQLKKVPRVTHPVTGVKTRCRTTAQIPFTTHWFRKKLSVQSSKAAPGCGRSQRGGRAGEAGEGAGAVCTQG